MTPDEKDVGFHDRPTPIEGFDPALSKKHAPRLTEPPKRTQSGQHPLVGAFRRKMASIVEGQAAIHDDLDAKIDEATRRLKTPLPPKDDEDEEATAEEKTPTSH